MTKKNGKLKVIGLDAEIEGFIIDRSRVSHKATRRAAMTALRASNMLQSENLDADDMEEAEMLLVSVDEFYGSQVMAIPDDWWSDDRPPDVDVDSPDFMEYITQEAYEHITRTFQPEVGTEKN